MTNAIITPFFKSFIQFHLSSLYFSNSTLLDHPLFMDLASDLLILLKRVLMTNNLGIHFAFQDRLGDRHMLSVKINQLFIWC